jgi:hypothetical protein
VRLDAPQQAAGRGGQRRRRAAHGALGGAGAGGGGPEAAGAAALGGGPAGVERRRSAGAPFGWSTRTWACHGAKRHSAAPTGPVHHGSTRPNPMRLKSTLQSTDARRSANHLPSPAQPPASSPRSLARPRGRRPRGPALSA